MKKNKEPQILEGVTIEKLVFGGQGLAYHNGKPVFVWNVLPGEVVNVLVLKKRKGVIEGIAQEIVQPSEKRIVPIDDHYLSSAPWQIMTKDTEKELKKEIALETFKKLAGIKLKKVELVGDDNFEGYRNKMEFGFFLDSDDQLNLSLFNRGSRYPRAVTSCSIAMPALWQTAQKILDELRKQKISRWDLKYLVIRTNQKGQSVVGLFVQKEEFNSEKFLSAIKLDDQLIGIQVYYSTPKSPASVVTKYLGGLGQDWIREDLLQTSLSYGIHSFFQVNPPVFEKTLEKMAEYIPQDSDVLDFYSGVGSISIPLHSKINTSVVVDSNAEAIEYAQRNIKELGLQGYTAHASEAEKIVEEITSDKLLILDPPRAGLHKDVTHRILEVLPETIIYLSCNISTQARDVALLKNNYEIIDMELYDYFPRTPHFESLVILKKKKPSVLRKLLG